MPTDVHYELADFFWPPLPSRRERDFPQVLPIDSSCAVHIGDDQQSTRAIALTMLGTFASIPVR